MCFNIFNKKSSYSPLCPVCLELLSTINKPLYGIECGHVLCETCIFTIDKNIQLKLIKCPICRNIFSYNLLATPFICFKCNNDIIKLYQYGKYLTFLKCGHTYCYSCLTTYNYYYTKCRQCKVFKRVYPLYLL